MKFIKNKTNRGFAHITFKDRYNLPCSLQKSSLATEDAIWFGIDDPQPKIMAWLALSLGIKTTPATTTGWVPYPIPKEVLIHSRMHLTRSQIKDIIPLLQKFVDTGEL